MTDSNTGKKKPSGRKKIGIGCLGLLGGLAILSAIKGGSEGHRLPQHSAEATESTPRADAAKLENEPTISKSEFSALRTGMTYAEAAQVIGGEGELISENSIAGTSNSMYQWEGEGSFGANANAMFQNGRLIQKSQFGLE